MTLPNRHRFSAMILGAGVVVLTAIGPGVWSALADEMPGFIDSDRLIKFDTDDYTVSHADWVSREPLGTQTVTKIEAGKIEYVTIARTATGTYSSDALLSPHVLYPGITVEPVQKTRLEFWTWANGSWTWIHTDSGKTSLSISSYKSRDGRTHTNTCIGTGSFWQC